MTGRMGSMVVVLALAALWGVAPCPAAHARSTVAAAVPQDRTGMALRHQLGGRSYQLAAVHPEPAAGRILQEYLPPGQVLGQQTEMLMIDLVQGRHDPVQAAQRKLQEIQARREQGDMLANGELLLGPGGSAAVDFVLSATLPGGGLVVEWNAYHYRQLDGALVLTGLSRRAYGDEAVTAFLTGLKERRGPDRNALLAWQPELSRP
ncbi:hypothetical protein ABXT00_00555 [Stenotrophomonas koreensis]|jgi:hypothetical protein|uniref:hypothetical protein n=1 Tax=Stenotrophomonas koreensis TaxID=266128 RepID=UPI003391825F